MKFTLAMAQMLVTPGDPAGNVARAVQWVRRAADQGAHLVVLPEALTTGWTHPSASQCAEAIPEGETTRRLSAAARETGLHVCAGLVERAGERIFNSAVLLNPAGDILLVHRKINELDIGHACYALGDRLGVVDTPLGRLGVMICADGFATGQALSRALGLMGAEVILSPCAWAVPAGHDPAREPYGQLWRDNYAPVAREFGLWIAGVSNVGPITAGPWAGRQCIGCSLLMGPNGQAAAQGPHGVEAEALVLAVIHRQPRPRPWHEPPPPNPGRA